MRAPGFYPDIPEAEYHADRESLSVSGAKVLLKAPALFKWQQDNPVHRDVFDFGSAAHALVLGKGMESIYVTPCDEFRTAAAKAEKAEAQRVGLSIITPADWLKVCDMADALASHSHATELLSDGAAEVSAYAPHDYTGVLRRCRYDYIKPGLGVDYKSAADVSPRGFAKAVANYGYDQQNAWYVDVAAALGEDIDFKFIAQAKEPPYLVEVYDLEPAWVERGRRLNEQALDVYAACTTEGNWPGYTGANETTLYAPAWMTREDHVA